MKKLKQSNEEAKNTVLELRDFSMAFGENVLFTNFDYAFEPGIYAFRGPSGVGKSTVMRIIAGLETRYSGDVVLNGKKLTSYTPEIHMVHQHYTLFPWLNVLKNTLMVYKGHQEEITSEAREEAKDILNRLGLGEHMDKLPSQISGGQAQRVSLASAFMNKWSKVVLYDEPSSALDMFNDMLIVEMIKERQRKYNTIEIVITHEDHVVEGLGAKILEFTPEFRLRPPKEKTVIQPEEAVEPHIEAEHLKKNEVREEPGKVENSSQDEPVIVEGVTENEENVETVSS